MPSVENFKSTSSDMAQRVREALERVRPFIQSDGGDVELVDVDTETKKVIVRLVGACTNCAMSDITLKQGIEDAIRTEAPEVSEVIAI